MYELAILILLGNIACALAGLVIGYRHGQRTERQIWAKWFPSRFEQKK